MTPAKKKLWRMIRGKVQDACRRHPHYFTTLPPRRFMDSVTKRVFGDIVSGDGLRLLMEVAGGSSPATQSVGAENNPAPLARSLTCGAPDDKNAAGGAESSASRPGSRERFRDWS